MLLPACFPDRSRLLRLALMAVAAIPVPALAEEASPESIIVTARRQEERFHDVPLAVDVVTAKTIATAGVTNLQTLASHVPGLSFEAGWGGFNSFPVLRGQSQPSIAGDNVGMFVDGVYQASRDAIDVEPLDLARIEVVDGPQSALFGHSTFAGLIHYVPALPTEHPLAMTSADAGTDNLMGLSGTISGPIDAIFKSRLAASWRQQDGTWENAAAPGQHLGNSQRLALAAAISTRDGSGPFSLRLSGRYGDSRSNQPPAFALVYRTYNCGARDANSGAWSYYCGAAPIPGQVAISPNLPDSHTSTGQLALHLAVDFGGVELRSDSSLYRAESGVYRDIDGSAEGDLYGVCIQGVNCAGIGSLAIPVVRLQRVNIVLRRSLSAREIAQELRLQDAGDGRFSWMLGGTVFWTRLRTTLAFGGERGTLSEVERLTSPVLSNLQRVGSVAAINAALVDDPSTSQIVFNDSIEERRTIAFFAAADYRIVAGLRLRGELRSTWERLTLDSRTANFVPSFGTVLGAHDFHDISPRISLDWRPAEAWLVFTSYAKGSRSGGINAIPNLRPDEQTFLPETNWTAELGVKYAGTGLVRGVQLTAYDIDWRNTQIQGISATPGFAALIIRNTRGIHTKGVEAGAQLVPTGWLALDLAWSYTDPRFKSGSEDPGDGSICGLSAGNRVSSFCTIRPSAINSGDLVPDIAGKLVARAAKTSWSAAVTVAPRLTALRGLRLRADVTYQGNVYDRQVGGLYYGARKVVGARLSLPLGPLEAELWGTNLTDVRYARVAAPRQPVFYNNIPRPTDLILGDGRRMGLTLRYSLGK